MPSLLLVVFCGTQCFLKRESHLWNNFVIEGKYIMSLELNLC